MARIILACVLLLLPSFALTDDFDEGAEALGKKKYDLAIASFTAAIKEDPRSAKAFIGRGFAYDGKNDYAKAIEDFSAAIRLDPKNPRAHFYRGNAYESKKDYAKAIEDFSEAIRLDPMDVDYLINRGIAHNKKKDYEKTVKDYAEAIRLEPENPRGYDSLAWMLATCPKAGVRDGKKAVEYATKACQLTEWKSLGFSLDNLAAAHAECGNFEAAVKCQQAAVELGFTDEEIMAGARKRLALYRAGKPYHGE